MKKKFFGFSKNVDLHNDDSIDRLGIINEDTPFSVQEAFRTAYTNILYLPIEDKCKKLAFTSAFSGEGKTYVSINLAITLAQNSDNRKVLLIDADMRKPRIARLLDFDEHTNGLSEYLANVNDEPNIIETKIPNLFVLLSGEQNINPVGLLNSQRMQQLISKCEESFDYLIIDTPPVNIVSDALIIGKSVNGYMLVVRADRSDINTLGDAIEALTQAGANIYGFILSDYNPKGNYNKNGAYKKYGKYGSYDSYGYQGYGK